MTYRQRLLYFLIAYMIWIGPATVLVGTTAVCVTPDQPVISGQVIDADGEPVYLAHIDLRNHPQGAVTDEEGYFQLQPEEPGSYRLVISRVGMSTETEQVEVTGSESADLEIILHRDGVESEEVTITAGAYTTGEEERVTLSPMEVVSTPGASADIFQTFQMLPGIMQVDEGSGMYVRGGDVSEVAFYLDQAPVEHPYRYETPTGGAFGTIPPFLVSDTYFSTGGFSAKYGDALSAVLSMESQNRSEATTLNLNAGLAAQSLGADVPLGDEFGVRFSGNRSSTETMFRLNNLDEDFEEMPQSRDGNLSLMYEPDSETQITFFNFVATNRVGVSVDQPSFSDTYTGKETNRMHNLQWSRVFGDWWMQTNVSFSRFEAERRLGGMDLTTIDRTWNARSDWEYPLTEDTRLDFGGEWHHKTNRFSGSVPEEEYLLDPSSGFAALDESYPVSRFGGYAELETELASRLFAVTGVRSDYQQRSDEAVVDPRFRLSYNPEPVSLSLATGRYHQFPEPFAYNEETGNPDLNAQQAWHYIASAEYRQDLLHIRGEGYYKDYQNLVIEAEEENVSNRGYGDAYGADLFLKYSEYLRTRFNGWISYSFLRSERLQPALAEEGFRYETAPSDFDITHSLNLVGKIQLVSTLSVGAAWRFSTGRPYTPVADAAPDPHHDYYHPIEGEVNSERLPAFQRLDMNASYFLRITRDLSMVLYGSVSNMFDRDNVMDYTYNRDYSEREPVHSNYRRFVYFGFTLEHQF